MKKIMIRRLGVMSVAKFIGVAYALIGLIYGFFALFGGMVIVFEQNYDVFTKIAASFGVVIVGALVIPAIMFLLGWAYGAVFSLVANFVLQGSDGIEIDYEEKK